MTKKVKQLGNVLHLIPLLVIAFEYTAVSSALAYARFYVDAEPDIISLFGGLIKIGGSLPYDAIPNIVVTLHLLALLLSVVYFIYFMIFSPHASVSNQQPVPPQEG